jgi:hypothetical protein
MTNGTSDSGLRREDTAGNRARVKEFLRRRKAGDYKFTQIGA